MIKVCHIVNIITGKTDGVYTHLKMIFTNSDRSKFRHYLIFQGGEKIENELSQMGIEFFVSKSLKKKISLKAFRDIFSFVKDNGISIIHTHLIKPYAIAGLVNIFLRKKFIFNYNGLFLSENIYYGVVEKTIYRFIHSVICFFKAVDIVLVPSQKSKELLMKDTHLFPEPIVYYNGFNIQLEHPQETDTVKEIIKIKEEGIIIALVARLEKQKRVDRALNLFKQVYSKRKDIRLLIFGDGELRQKFIEQAEASDLRSDIIFFDYVPDLIYCYYYFEILLFTSDWEGTPLSLFEAMAYKVPVLAPDVGGFKEILEVNNCGLVYSPGNMKDAEEKLLKLIGDDNLRKELGKNGNIAIQKKYNVSNFIRQIETVYFNLLQE
jgi:glycosyltransferase involved in cell wall biosynthesis